MMPLGESIDRGSWSSRKRSGSDLQIPAICCGFVDLAPAIVPECPGRALAGLWHDADCEVTHRLVADASDARVASETVGHALVARFLDPRGERHMVIARTTQDYLEFLYAAIVVCLVLRIAASPAGRSRRSAASGPRPLPAWRVSALPSVVFLAQEHVESFVHNGDAGWFVTAEPAVLFGPPSSCRSGSWPCGSCARCCERPRGSASCWHARPSPSASERPSSSTARRSNRSGCSASRAGWPSAHRPSFA